MKECFETAVSAYILHLQREYRLRQLEYTRVVSYLLHKPLLGAKQESGSVLFIILSLCILAESVCIHNGLMFGV